MNFDLPAPGADGTGMFRSAFGDPKPASLEQLRQALDEIGISATLASVVVDHCPDDEPPFRGWSAEFCDDIQVSDEADDEGEEWETRMLNTAGFPTKEALMDVLTQVGVRTRNIHFNERDLQDVSHQVTSAIKWLTSE
jgi:hypothetical protein